MRSIRLAALTAIAIVTTACAAADAQVAPKPTPGQNIMTWTQEQRTEWFRNLERTVPTAVVKHGTKVHPLPHAPGEFDVQFTLAGEPVDIAGYMRLNNVNGLLVMKDGKILTERYGLGRGEQDRWTAWSVTKSVTSTLVGAAIKDGAIHSVDDPVTTYLPELVGSAYDGVTVKNLLNMASGVKWDEDYESQSSDFFHMLDQPFIDQMKTLPREVAPGSKFHYNTGDTNLLGLVVARAVKKPISQYLSEKIWAPYGMEQDATWWTNHGQEVAGANLSMTLRDFARFGQFFMDGGKIDGESVLPDGWLEEASAAQLPTGWQRAPGYGYKWWVQSPGKFMALGIFGQTIYIEPAKKLVVVLNQSWPRADNDTTYSREMPFLQAVSAAVD